MVEVRRGAGAPGYRLSGVGGRVRGGGGERSLLRGRRGRRSGARRGWVSVGSVWARGFGSWRGWVRRSRGDRRRVPWEG